MHTPPALTESLQQLRLGNAARVIHQTHQTPQMFCCKAARAGTQVRGELPQTLFVPGTRGPNIRR
jgi:hypothetical protein